MVNVNWIKRYVQKNFPHFGLNKRRQIVRLLYEIGKREGITLTELVQDIPRDTLRFSSIKSYLLRRRYPCATLNDLHKRVYLPELEFKPDYRFRKKKGRLRPKNIYVEEDVKNSYIARRLKEKFARAKFVTIPSLKEYVQKHKIGLVDFNARQENLFLIRERGDFFKRCPCTAQAISCNYHIFNLGFGCEFECSYCFLQKYSNAPGIIVATNIEDFFCAFQDYPHNIRLGTGEFIDSLALDDITEFSPQLVNFVKKFPHTVLELKTKSDNIGRLVNCRPSANVVVAWSLNPQGIIAQNEFYCPSLSQRLEAASCCVEAGFNVAFHFDPLIYYQGWEKDYADLVSHLFTRIPARYICWISLGSLRFARTMKRIIENRFPQNSILNEELFLGFDGKLRYSEKVRLDLYLKMIKWIRRYSRRVFIYLCMEDKAIWQACGLYPAAKAVFAGRKSWLGREKQS